MKLRQLVFLKKATLSFLILSTFSLPVLAQTPPTPDTEESIERPQIRAQLRKPPSVSGFLVGSEFTQTSGETGSIAGVGPRVGFEYALAEKLSMAANLSFSVQATGKPGAYFYSGFTGSFRYTVSGWNFLDRNEISDGTQLIMDLQRTRRPRFQLGGGIEQLFLNGSVNIYPAIGFFGQGVYGFELWDTSFEADLRISQLLANQKPFMLIGMGLSMSFNL